jgi:hypothetical protein
MKSPRLTVVFAGLVVLGLSRVVEAHHSFAAEFDANQPVLLRGKVTQVEWINPHSWVHIEVELDDGTTQSWMVEGGTANTMLRAGFTRDSLAPGTEIVVRGFRSRDPSCMPACRANGRDVTFTDGSKVFMGAGSVGAPE